jgi:hypothetical protein
MVAIEFMAIVNFMILLPLRDQWLVIGVLAYHFAIPVD